MILGEKISELRKEKNLSQDSFAELFHVTRQTVSNWENGKSYPDLEIILKISDEFQVSVDELLKDDSIIVKKIDSEKKKKKSLLVIIGVLVILFIVSIFGIYKNYEMKNKIDFSMQQSQTYQKQETAQDSLNVGTGYFMLPKGGKISLKVNADIDDGKLHIKVIDKDENIYYQLNGEILKDSQTLFLENGSYIIQIIADDYTQDIVSLSYSVKIEN
ncbi:MAG: helix-turn-helix transcriptional regulator [Lachnospiraceae bacterium]